MSDLSFRDARAADVDAVVPLLYESSKRLFDYVLAGADPRGFLRRDFLRGGGLFGRRHLVVGVSAGEVVCTQTFYRGSQYSKLLRQTVLSGLGHFGPVQLARIALRGRTLSSLFVAPRHDGLFMANGCVSAGRRGEGVFTALIEHAVQRASAAGAAVLELDVSFSNHKAEQIFERFGFRKTAERPYRGRGDLDGFRRMERPVTRSNL